MQLKQSVYNTCLQLLNNKIQALQNTIHELSEGAISDGKSSAGDKHETARAMMQLEQEKISKQLDEVLAQKATLQKIDVTTTTEQITKGSLVKTNKGYLFLSIALGKVNTEGIDVIVLSPQSPLGIKLIGLKAKSTVTINSTEYVIEEVL
jgi:transcription elongation GreA/GreB family factor